MSARNQTHGALATLKNVPKELRSYRQWVAWKLVPGKNGNLTKVPVNPHTGGNARSDIPAT